MEQRRDWKALPMTGSTYVMLADRGAITIAGKDRHAFLQGLVSNDVEKVAHDRVVWAALLTPQGKYLHDFFIAAQGDRFLIDCEADRLMDLGRTLSRYKLRADVELGIGDDLAVAAVPGADGAQALGLSGEPGAATAFAGGIAWVDPRLAAMGARVLAPKADLEDALIARGLAAGARADFDDVRLDLGLADGSRDMIVEKSILLESGFDELGGVDWDKGCYMGQELTARTKYRGLIKKRLMPVRFDGLPPAPGTQVTLDGRDAGEMRSGAAGQGLALLRLEQVAKAAETGMPLMAGATALEPRRPDWMAE